MISINGTSSYNIIASAINQQQDKMVSSANSIANILTNKTSSSNSANLYIQSKLNSQTSGNTQAQQNTQIASNYLSIAESTVAGIQDNLTRIQELATQAANGFYSQDARDAIQSEINQLSAQIDQNINSANFNGQKVLVNTQPEADPVRFQIGSDSSENSAIYYNPNINLPTNLTFDVSTPEAAAATLDQINSYTKELNNQTSQIGALQNTLSEVQNQLGNDIINEISTQNTLGGDLISAISDLKQSEISQEILIKTLSMIANTDKAVMQTLTKDL